MTVVPKEKDRKSWGGLFLSLFDGSIADLWFRWAEWLLVTAALYGAGSLSGSIVLKVFAHISGWLLLFHVLGQIDNFNETYLAGVRKFRPLLRLVVAIAILVIGGFLLLALTNAIDAVLSDQLVTP